MPFPDAELDFLFTLLRTPSPTGFEAAGQRVWAAHVRSRADRVEADAYGNAWATRDGAGGPRVMLEAHADEIGFAVKHVTDDGYLRVDRIGGTDHAIARARRVVFEGANGPVPGVLGNTAIHLRDRDDDKLPKVEDLFVDVGASDREGVAALGLRVGHPGVYADAAERLSESRVAGRALDNRLGGFVLAQVLARLGEGDRPAATAVALNAVQEEIGGNGARMATYQIRPDVAVVLDVTHATDSPGIDAAKHGSVKLGSGPSVTHGTVNHPAVVQRLVEVAEAEGIPLQHESSSRYSGTDTDVIFTSRAGIPSALVSIPMRYMHSTVETVDLGDVEHTVALLVAFVRSVRADDRFATDVLGNPPTPDPMPDDSPRCLRCGSDSVIPDVRLIDRGESDMRHLQEVGVQKNPAAMMMKGEVRSKTRAQVCADCGFVEVSAVDPEALWQAHLERIANGWTS